MTSQDALLAELIKSLRGTDVLANYGAKTLPTPLSLNVQANPGPFGFEQQGPGSWLQEVLQGNQMRRNAGGLLSEGTPGANTIDMVRTPAGEERNRLQGLLALAPMIKKLQDQAEGFSMLRQPQKKSGSSMAGGMVSSAMGAMGSKGKTPQEEDEERRKAIDKFDQDKRKKEASLAEANSKLQEFLATNSPDGQRPEDKGLAAKFDELQMKVKNATDDIARVEKDKQSFITKGGQQKSQQLRQGAMQQGGIMTLDQQLGGTNPAGGVFSAAQAGGGYRPAGEYSLAPGMTAQQQSGAMGQQIARAREPAKAGLAQDMINQQNTTIPGNMVASDQTGGVSPERQALLERAKAIKEAWAPREPGAQGMVNNFIDSVMSQNMPSLGEMGKQALSNQLTGVELMLPVLGPERMKKLIQDNGPQVVSAIGNVLSKGGDAANQLLNLLKTTGGQLSDQFVQEMVNRFGLDIGAGGDNMQMAPNNIRSPYERYARPGMGQGMF